jgi:hypothetical protein
MWVEKFQNLAFANHFSTPFFDSKFGSRFGTSFWGYSTLDVDSSQQAVPENFAPSRTKPQKYHRSSSFQLRAPPR